MAELAVARDWNLTDNEKWAHKVALMQLAVEQLEKQQAAYDAIAQDSNKPQGERDGANKASEATGEKVQQAKTALLDAGPNPDSFTQNFQSDITKLKSSWGSLQQEMASGLTGVISNGLNTVESNLDRMIMKTETWKQGLVSIGMSIETSLVSAFVKMATQWVASQIMMAVAGKAVAAASAAANVPLAAAEAATWATPATLATIASFGGAAVQAPAAIMAAMAATQGLALFEKGGALGDGYGLAEPGEYVFNKQAVQNIGVDNLESAHRAAKSGWNAPASGGGSGSGRGDGKQPIHIHQHQSHTDALRAALKTRDGRSLVHDISTGAVKEYRR